MQTKQPIFNQDTFVKDIVIQFSQASDYFRRLKVDFCCGGKRPLREALVERNLDVDTVLRELEKLYLNRLNNQQSIEHLEDSSALELIALIVNKHHAYLRRELPAVEQNVARVFHVHGADPDQPHLQELYTLFMRLKAELLEHTGKEETEVFPKMIQFEGTNSPEIKAKLAAELCELEVEHEAAGDILKRIRVITNDFTPPEGACTTYRLTYARLAELEGMTFEHVHLENNILFSRFQVNNKQ